MSLLRCSEYIKKEFWNSGEQNKAVAIYQIIYDRSDMTYFCVKSKEKY